MKSVFDTARADVSAAQKQLAVAQGTKTGLQADLNGIADTVYQQCSEVGNWPTIPDNPSTLDPSYLLKRDAFLRKLLVAALVPAQTASVPVTVPDLDKLQASDLVLLRSLEEIANVVKCILLG